MRLCLDSSWLPVTGEEGGEDSVGVILFQCEQITKKVEIGTTINKAQSIVLYLRSQIGYKTQWEK